MCNNNNNNNNDIINIISSSCSIFMVVYHLSKSSDFISMIVVFVASDIVLELMKLT